MRFKIDENPPVECVELLRQVHHDATTAVAEGLRGAVDPDLIAVCHREERILITLDQGFGDIRAYPPHRFPGIIVLRPQRQDKRRILELLSKLITRLTEEPLANRLWIVEETRIRIRGDTE